MENLTRSAKRMIKKYGQEKCLEAFNLYDDGNMGGRGVGYDLGVTTNTADALISAGREITEQQETSQEMTQQDFKELLESYIGKKGQKAIKELLSRINSAVNVFTIEKDNKIERIQFDILSHRYIIWFSLTNHKITKIEASEL